MSGFEDAGEVQVPDVAEPLRAFRLWSAKGFALTGAFGLKWEPGETMTATCQAVQCDCEYCAMLFGVVQPHECPSPTRENHGGYGCGIYGYLTPELLATHGTAPTVDAPMETAHHAGFGSYLQLALFGYQAPVVWGEVEMWGRVMAHAGGYRAQHARIVRLFDFSETARLAARFYGVPCEPFPLDDETREGLRQEEKTTYTVGVYGTSRIGTSTGGWGASLKGISGQPGITTYKPGDLSRALGIDPPKDDLITPQSYDSTVVDRWQQAQRDKDPVRAKFRRMFLEWGS